MRHFLHSPALAAVQWFMFLDDDVFVRPHALSGFLSEVAKRQGRPKAFVGCIGDSKGLYFTGNSSLCAPNKKDLPRFCWAMPAILNRPALVHMQRSIDSEMLIQLQSEWGNSHDVILVSECVSERGRD